MGVTNARLAAQLKLPGSGRLKALKQVFDQKSPTGQLVRQLLGRGPNSTLRSNFKSIESSVFPALEAYAREISPKAEDDSIEYRLSRRRIWKARQSIVPWLAKSMPFQGARVLEIGCGSGSNAIAYAEQGAQVTGADIDTEALLVARERARLYGLDAEFLEVNAAEIDQAVDLSEFDLIVFYASLEHMTIPERQATMGQTWRGLKKGGFWSLVETPNRLWIRDGHTAWLPFFHWLPDELAIPYLSRSPKPRLQALAGETDPLLLQRRGRGVSFHEFDLFMQDATTMDVVSSLHSLPRFAPKNAEQKFSALLAQQNPKLHPGFFHENLDLLIRKD